MDRFAALADPNRRRIVEMIAAAGALPAGDISKGFGISAPAVSQHLKVLREAGLLRMERRAQQRIYTLDRLGVDETWEWLGQMRAMWNARFDALDALLKSDKKEK